MNGIKLGLPRALLFHGFAPAWVTFLTALGVNLIVSPPTNKALMELGLQAALDDICLPIKLFLGHAVHLSSDCDVLLIPHLISLERRTFTCPKFMGLPDLVRQALPATRILSATVDIQNGLSWEDAAYKTASFLGFRKKQMAQAFHRARLAQLDYDQGLKNEALPPPLSMDGQKTTLAVLGHPYCLYDSFLNMNLFDRLKKAGYRIITPEMLPDWAINEGLSHLKKDLFWSFGRRQLGALHYLLSNRQCRGIIHLAAFACGPEALVGELVGREVARKHVPLLRFHLDEHTGEAGFITRLEAFLDMMGRWRE